MPRKDNGPVEKIEDLSLSDRLSLINDRCQEHWYRLVGEMAKGKRVLDVGAGTGYGLDILKAAGCSPSGIDLLPAGIGVARLAIEDIASAAFDWVIAIDVIEHVEDDHYFLEDMEQAAINNVFFSTPNWNRSKVRSRWHVREYTPHELQDLIAYRRHEFWSSDDDLVAKKLETLEADSSFANFGVLIHLDPF